MNYELTYIINPELKPEKIASTTKEVIKAIEKINGKVVKNSEKAKKNTDKNSAKGIPGGYFFQEPTRQKLAYPIRHFDFGYYTTVDFTLSLEEDEDSKNDLKSLDDKLKLMDDILRHIIIKKEKIKEVPKRKRPKKETKLADDKSDTDKKKPEISAVPESGKEIKEKIAKKEDKNKKSKKANLEDIDEKLDKILTDI